jgi:Caspase domain
MANSVLRILFAGVVVLFTIARPLQADTSNLESPRIERYALLIGADKGLAHETPLRFATSDVDEMASALETVGAFAPEHIVRLKNANADRVREVLVDLNLTIQKQTHSGNQAMLFVYFSGHGSDGKLHLDGTTLRTEELSKLVRLSSARLKLLLLDACRAGTLTRVKGGRQVEPFTIGLADSLQNEGYAIITSSAAGEDAQESDSLGSSIFTHHFIAALRGLGDTNNDRVVTLGEAYGYAYNESLRTSMTTVAGSQHATFDYDLRGRADPVLSDLRRQENLAMLVLEPGDYLIEPRLRGGPLVEAHVLRSGTPIALAAAEYVVRMRRPNQVREARVTLQQGVRTPLVPSQMDPLPLAQIMRKGEVSAQLATGPVVMGSIHGPVSSGFSAASGMNLGWAFELPTFSVTPQLWLGRSRSQTVSGDVLSHTVDEATFDVAVSHAFDFGFVSLAPHAALGAAWLFQEVRLQSGTVQNRPVALFSSLGMQFTVPIGEGFAVESSSELATFQMSRQDGTRAPETATIRSGTITYRLGLGLGYRY